MKVAQLPSGLDPADLILKEGNDAWKAAIRDSKDIITFLLDVLDEYAKSPDVFRRSVETVVLPFLQDVRSPIARESYVREVASRLGVSEGAVLEALGGVPKSAEPKTEVKAAKLIGDDRPRAALALLLWQESLPASSIDIGELERKIKEALGTAALEKLRELPADEQEALRFRAERLYGASTKLSAKRRASLTRSRRTRSRRSSRLFPRNCKKLKKPATRRKKTD